MLDAVRLLSPGTERIDVCVSDVEQEEALQHRTLLVSLPDVNDNDAASRKERI